jgi:DNA-directed RNA polymerase I subunit RPA43
MNSTQLYASSSKSSPKKRKSSDGTEPNKKRRKSESNDDTDREFHVASASLTLSIPPTFAGNPRIGAEEMLDSMVMRSVQRHSYRLRHNSANARYIPSFEGVVLGHSNLKFQDKNATIKMDCPFLVCSVSFDATVWSPRVGMKLGEFDSYLLETTPSDMRQSFSW